MIYTLDPNQKLPVLQVNDYVVTTDKKTLIEHVDEDLGLSKIPDYERKIKGGNIEHHVAIDAIGRSQIQIVSLWGYPRSGKTFVSLGCAIEDVIKGKYEKLIVVRDQPPATRNGMGYLPGGLDEKLGPRFEAITDTMDSLARHTKMFKRDPRSEIEDMVRYGKLEYSTLEFMRGRNFENTVIICDDAQNLFVDGIRLLVTRMSKNSKLILTGDLAQVDDPSNRHPGMEYLDKVMSGSKYYTKIVFTQCYLTDGVVAEFLAREEKISDRI